MVPSPDRWEYLEPEVELLDHQQQEAQFLRYQAPEPNPWARAPTVRPLCYLDIEQCLVISVGDPPAAVPAGDLRRTYLIRELQWGPYPMAIWVDRRLDFWLHELADRFDLVLASDWGPDAVNVAALLGLPDIDVLDSGWPPEIARHAADRPLAIVGGAHRQGDVAAMAGQLRQKFLAYTVQPGAGLDFDDVTRLIGWANSLEPSGQRALHKHRRAIRGRCAKLGLDPMVVLGFHSNTPDATWPTITLGTDSYVDPGSLHQLEQNLSKLTGVVVEIVGLGHMPFPRDALQL